MQPNTVPLRFGVFEVDLSTGEVRKQGLRVKLPEKAFELLLALLERPGELVSREALRQRLWTDDVFVEFDNNLNNTMSRLREALNDSAEAPRFIETIPRRGYRFIAPVEAAPPPASALPTIPDAVEEAAPVSTRPMRLRAAVVALLAVSVAGVVALSRYPPFTDPRPQIDSVAVLPFVAGHSQDDYLAFGVTEALGTELSRIAALKVTSQTSSSQYKSGSKAVPQIARELGVAGIVEGSVVREGETLRIAVRLIDGARGGQLWAGTYVRQARSLLQMQHDVARAVARELRVEVTPQSAGSASATLDLEVHDAYLRGRFALGLGTETERADAVRHFEHALAIDPRHAPSYAGLATYYTVTDSLPASIAMPKARTYARRALELDGTLPDAHASLAAIHYYADWDWQAAEARFVRALEGDPGNSRTRRWYAMYLSTMGRHSEAVEHVQRALDMDPLSVMALDSAGLVWIHARRTDRALDAGRNILTLRPDSPIGFEHLAIASLLSKEHTRAKDMIHKGLEVSGRDPLFLMLRAYLHGVLGERAAMRETLDELTEKARTGFVPPTFFAIAWLGLNETEAAITRLEEGFAAHDPYLVLLKVSPWFDELRDVPRFQQLLERMNFPG